MLKIKFIYADLQKLGDKKDSLALTTLGTSRDLKRHSIEFKESDTHWFWTDNTENNPLIFKAVVRFNEMLNIWIADLDTESIRPFSESEFTETHSVREIFGEK